MWLYHKSGITRHHNDAVISLALAAAVVCAYPHLRTSCAQLMTSQAPLQSAASRLRCSLGRWAPLQSRPVGSVAVRVSAGSVGFTFTLPGFGVCFVTGCWGATRTRSATGDWATASYSTATTSSRRSVEVRGRWPAGPTGSVRRRAGNSRHTHKRGGKRAARAAGSALGRMRIWYACGKASRRCGSHQI